MKGGCVITVIPDAVLIADPVTGFIPGGTGIAVIVEVQAVYLVRTVRTGMSVPGKYAAEPGSYRFRLETG